MDTNYFDELLYIAELLKTETNTSVQVARSFKDEKLYSISLDGCETKLNKDDVILVSHTATGKTIEEAAEEYIDHLMGKLLVFHAYSPRRIDIPAYDLFKKWNEYVEAQKEAEAKEEEEAE